MLNSNNYKKLDSPYIPLNEDSTQPTSVKTPVYFQNIQEKLPKSLILKVFILSFSIPLTIIGLAFALILMLVMFALIIAALAIITVGVLVVSPILWIKNGFSVKNIAPSFSLPQTDDNEETTLLGSISSKSIKYFSNGFRFFKRDNLPATEENATITNLVQHSKYD